MAKRINISTFLSQGVSVPFIDVRSPKEYTKGHIPGAISLPLFTDDERADVGTLYKRKGRSAAVRKGLEFVGPNMVSFIDQAVELGSDTINIYCWRGGMRSESMSWLLEKYGLKTNVLEGGYKSYRTAMIDFYSQKLPLKVVAGYTGSKKTELLHRIENHGGQMIDLEGRANHQGSSFGNQKSLNQPSTEHFQNLIYSDFLELDLSRPIYIEDESARIGKVTLSEELYRQMTDSPYVVIDVDQKERVDFLIEDYGQLEKTQLIWATNAIAKKLGHEQAEHAIKAIESGDLKSAAEILLTYYDKRYEIGITAKESKINSRHKIKMSELDTLAAQLAKDGI